MTTIAQDEPRRVTGGVDTHKDIHVAAVLDVLGRLVAFHRVRSSNWSS